MTTVHLPFLSHGDYESRIDNIDLPLSKSECNRMLLLWAIDPFGYSGIVKMAESRDSELLLQALNVQNGVADVQDAGTAMRFATAFHALHTKPGQRRVIQGTERMHQRPIGPLVDALRSLGADITYLGQEGYPPLSFGRFVYTGNTDVYIDTSLSSQFASALLLCATGFEHGLNVHLTGNTVSASYIDLTLGLLKRNEVPVSVSDAAIYVGPANWAIGISVYPEADWSAVGYWLSFSGITGIPIVLANLDPETLQGDRAVLEYFGKLGLDLSWGFLGDHTLYAKGMPLKNQEIDIDFTLIPDQAQTLIVYAAARGIKLRASGLSTLRIKETDRIAALQTELTKVGCTLKEVNPGVFEVGGQIHEPHAPFSSHDDHRMAMSLAPLAGLFPITITGAESVRKSYPQFWQEVAKLYIGESPRLTAE